MSSGPKGNPKDDEDDDASDVQMEGMDMDGIDEEEDNNDEDEEMEIKGWTKDIKSPSFFVTKGKRNDNIDILFILLVLNVLHSSKATQKKGRR